MGDYLIVAKMQRMLLLRLSTSNPHFEESTYFRNFGQLTTNLARVNSVYEDMSKGNAFPAVIRDAKDDYKSQIFREEGNSAFRRCEYMEAWLMYTRSILAGTSAKFLTLAYANRAAVLYKLGKYKECLVDIGRAFANNYPEKLKPKLIVRRNNAKNMLSGSEPPTPYHRSVPEIPASEKHPTIQAARNCVEIAEDEKYGRHVIAARDIQIGETICIEKPYAFLAVNYDLLHCHWCSELCYNPIACDSCTIVAFCSETCKGQAWNAFHRHECPTLATFREYGFYIADLVSLRVALLARREKPELGQDDMYRSDRFKEISNLMAVTDLTVEQLHQRAIVAAYVYHIFLHHTTIFNSANSKIVKNQFKETLLSQILVANSNRMPIVESVTDGIGWKTQRTADALYSFASLFNHSCSPNVEYIHFGSTIVVKAMHTIQEGQQCFISYGPNYWSAIKVQRWSYLKYRYYFDCKCPACVNDWRYIGCQLRQYLWHRSPPVTHREIGMLPEESLDSYLQYLGHQLKKCEEYEPCEPVLRIKDLIFTCYRIAGNRRIV